MWVMVLFDLPTGTKKERSVASRFRNDLLDMGFEMSQYSVYFRFCGDRSKTGPYIEKIKRKAPKTGKISILKFTDKQFADIINIQNREITYPENVPEQILLF